MWSALVLAVWLGVQPWLSWPELFQETSHRLTLVICCVALGLLRFGHAERMRPLPRSLGWWVAALLLVMASHHWHLIRDAAYFTFFQETALFADGVLVVVALVWGLWALRQLPAVWFQRLPWAGLALVSLNLLLSLGQARGLNWHLGTPQLSDLTADAVRIHHLNPYHPSGFMGFDRCLGAYAVAWLPILWTWWKPFQQWPWVRPLAILPLGCVLLAAKVTTWIGVGVVVWWMLPGWKWKLGGVAACLAAAIWWSDGELVKKIPMRLLTWWHTAQAVSVYWLCGVGFHPMTSTLVRQKFGFALPGLHSDWLSLAFHAGAGIAAWAAGWVVWLVTQRPRTPMAKALQASLAGLAVMSLGQSVVSHASVASLALILMAWWWVEQQGVVA